MDTDTFLSYLNKANEFEGYEQVGWTDDAEQNEYQIIVPFPEGNVTLNCTRQDGRLVEIEIVMP
ncbi:hypothetical protein [Radiobacillus sp. PE A8.2]|uniref:hypothetical protein n=1 Tax=Radiobacillus sp. PE A8.2 TaxID=3380349 RepID=UPI003890B9BF